MESDDMWPKFGMGVLGLLIIFIVWLVVSTISHEHKVGNCYIDTHQGANNVGLWQNVDWYPDNFMGYYKTVQEAAAAAKFANCPIGP